MIGAALRAVHDGVDAECGNGGEEGAPQRLEFAAALKRLAGDRARAVVEYDNGLDRVHFGGVGFRVLTGPDESLLLAGEQHEADRALRLEARLRDRAGRLERA